MDYLEAKRYLDTLPDWERGRPVAGPIEHHLPRMRALLRRLDDPQRDYRSVIVGGTNGKGTVASLLEALLRTSAPAGLYTSPHLHTQRERIQVSGELLSKDVWADAVTLLYDCTRKFEEEGFGVYSKFEALTALAAHLFSAASVDFAVFEVGLGGQYDATNAWDHELSVLTSVAVDHTEVLGDDAMTIAMDKLEITRTGGHLFTTDVHEDGVVDCVREYCHANEIALHIADVESVCGTYRADDQDCVPYPIKVRPMLDRPCTFVTNARLALVVANHLLGDRLKAECAKHVVGSYQWPGRFERVVSSVGPAVWLDGAHNPAAAASLADDLRTLHPRWTFVISVGSGHDSVGVLQCLAPLAERVITTSSEHPKARPPQTLADDVPVGTETVVEPFWRDALERALSQDLPVCVTGSLALVARAREHFRLAHESEGITEEVALESLACIEVACRHLGLNYRRVSTNANILQVEGGRPIYFLRNRHPFNDYVSAKIAEDKGYQYELFTAADVPMPFSMQVFNPYADDRFQRYKTHDDIDLMLDDIESRIAYPLLIKKPRSSVSQGVYVERNRKTATKRIENLFRGGGFLENALLIQSYIEGSEYRIVASEHILLLAYEKSSDESAGGKHVLNPLHHTSGRAVKVKDEQLLAEMARLTRHVASVLNLGFYAIDVIGGDNGLSVLEINPNPFCYFYNRTNSREDFVAIYEYLLDSFLVGK